ncbi:DUF4434 domain-containing protein [Idiomarina aquatica]|uniref:DUF4434 domain-containing protein n=1 Tax=Idiomarina aquatica TaxID=1327752 RepID=A0AA94EH46_9GAMM|nr:DUF4434 domain-containing protein [Idiomarina aquatica]RUO45117.1 hypothetical protein CWE23_03600 [Idiomarina aquatica]
MAVRYQQRYFKRKRQCFAAAFCALLLNACASSVADTTNGWEKGIFFQPLHQDAYLSDAYWFDLTDYLKRVGIRRVYVQWTRHDNHRFQFPDNWLLRRLKWLDKDFELIIGLDADSQYFEFINESADSRYFQAYIQQNKDWLNELSNLTNALNIHVDGYYFPGEFNDSALSDQNFLNHVARTFSQWQQTLSTPIYVSTFYSGKVSPEHYRKQLLQLQQSGIRLLHQDGVGTQAVAATLRASVLKAIPTQTAVIRELFEYQSGTFAPRSNTDIEAAIAAATDSDAFFSLRYLPLTKSE